MRRTQIIQLEMNGKLRGLFILNLKNGGDLFEIMNPYGDGNCLFRCFSWLLWGSVEHHQLLRQLTCLELLQFRQWYQELHRSFSAEWNEILEMCFHISGSVKENHIFALSNALKKVFILYGTNEHTCGTFFPFRKNVYRKKKKIVHLRFFGVQQTWKPAIVLLM